MLKVGGGGGGWLTSDSKWGTENTFFSVTLYNFQKKCVCVCVGGGGGGLKSPSLTTTAGPEETVTPGFCKGYFTYCVRCTITYQ